MSTQRGHTQRSGNPFGAAAVIASVAAPVSLEEATAIARDQYGIEGELRRLTGEKDQNYMLRTRDGREYALKIIHPAEDRQVTNFHTSVLLQVASADPSLPVQRVVPTRERLSERPIVVSDGSERMMRLTTFLPGVIVRGLPASAERMRNLGRMLARLQLALAGFSHFAENHEIAWDIKHTMWQRSVAPEMDTEHKRRVMEKGLARFEDRILPVLGSLRAQVVHNDLSGDNLVVDPNDHDCITGILDFGDAAKTPVIADVAIGVSNALVEADDLLAIGLPLVSGFHEVKPLLPGELDLLLDLVIARMVVRVGITEWRGRRFPENRDYILRTTPMTWRLLEALLRYPQDRARDAFETACRTR